MSTIALFVSVVAALLFFGFGWLLSGMQGKSRLAQEAGERIRVQTQLEKAQIDLSALHQEIIRLQEAELQFRLKEKATDYSLASITAKYEESLKAVQEQKEFVLQTRQALKESFDSLSASALDKNNRSFLDLAKTALTSHISETKNDLDKRQQAIDSLVKPLGVSLEKMEEKISQLELKREGAYGHLNGLLDQMRLTTLALDKETRNLVSALKTSHTRGRYGEIALRRLVEFSGMLDQCDFIEQQSVEGESGKLRPDMIIRLPGKRSVVVDSKVPLSAYLRIFETEDALLQKQLLAEHILAIKTHLRQLSAKAYWDQFEEAPDFVVLFMQIESSFGAALQAWPGLIEEALSNRIIVATPTTLITILRSVGYSWNQLKTMENIETIREAAVELYERSAILMEHITHIGKGLQGTLMHYNKAVGSLESQFLPQARRIRELSQAYVKKNIPDLAPVETMVRELPPKE